MDGIESGERSPEINVKQLEEKLLKGLKFLKERKPDCSHKDMKEVVRSVFMSEAELIGIPREEALLMVPYFLRLTYEDHKEADKMWGHLGELSTYSKNPDAAMRISTEILETTTGGTTPMWHLIEKIIKGELVVEKKEAANGKIYTLRGGEGKNDPERNQAACLVEEKFKDLIKQRPPLSMDKDVLEMSKQDGDLFFKIPQFMQEDSDAIVNSGTWHPIIEEYFKGVANHLRSTSKILSIESSKSNARKTRFKKFIAYIFQSYLAQLMNYCKNLATDRNQRNQFASDIMFEHYLVSNNLLTQQNKEPDYKIIEERWNKLFMEVKTHVQDNATLYMRAFDTPVAMPTVPVAPVATATPEVVKQTVQAVRARSSSALDQTIIGLSAMQEKPKTPANHAAGLKDAVTAEEREKLGKADTMIAIINQEYRSSPTQPIRTQDPEDFRLHSSAMLSYPYIGVVPGTPAEKELIDLVNKDVDALFAQNEDKLKSTGECENFIWQLKKIAKTRLSTKESMSAFFFRIIARYEDLLKKCNNQEKNNVFDNVSGVFNAIGLGSEMPNVLTRKLKSADKDGLDLKMGIPKAFDLNSLLVGVPSIESGEFAHLKDFLVKKGLYERFIEIESTLKEQMLAEDVQGFGVFSELNRRLSIAVSAEEAFAYYHNGKKEVIAEIIRSIKELTGNWFTKYFKFGRSAEVKAEMESYLSQLKESTDDIWTKAVKPTISQYGNIIFGADLYTQKA